MIDFKKNFLPFSIIFLNGFWTTPASDNEKASPLLTVAVAEFRTQGLPGELQVLGKSFPDALITKLGQTRAVRMVEREFLEQILAELKLQSSAFVDQSTAVQVGRLLGARMFVFGSVMVLAESVAVRARIVSVESAEILGEAEVKGEVNNLFGIQENFARQISAKLALQAALAEVSGLEVSKITISVYRDLETLRQLVKNLPFFGLDPGRAGKKADYLLALSLCDKLLNAYPNLALARYYRALFSLHNESFEVAERESQILQTVSPADLENLLLRGNILYAVNDRPGAAAAFREATAEFPDDPRGWYSLGRLLVAAGNKLEAIAAYIAAIERAPAIPEAETNLQTLLAGAEGPALLEQLKKQMPRLYPAARTFRAFWKNESAEIGDLAEKTMALFPDLYLGYFVQGLLEKNRRQYDKAAALLRDCLSLRPSFPEVHRELGLLLLENHRCAEGERHLTLYLRRAAFVSDYAALEQQIQRCKKRK